MNTDEVLAFAEAAKVLLNPGNKLSRCVDGRYEGLEPFPMIAKPGGDAGDVMAAFGALNELQVSLDPQVVLEAVTEEVGGKARFQFHTDDHAERDNIGVGMGCGHVKKATLEPADYGVTQVQMDFIKTTLPQLLHDGAHQEVLHGDHVEQAVVVVDSETYGLKPLVRTGESLQEAFVYHKTLHTEQLDRLARILQEKIAATGAVVEEQQVRQALDTAFGKQLTATLQRLAKDLPVYTVHIDADGAVTVA